MSRICTGLSPQALAAGIHCGLIFESGVPVAVSRSKRQSLMWLLGALSTPAMAGVFSNLFGTSSAKVGASAATPGSAGTAGSTTAGAAAPAAPAAAVAKPPPVFVLNSLDATISVIDPTTWTETTRLPTGKEPHHLYLTPDEKSIIVANATGDSLTFVDPRSGVIQRTVRDIVDPYHLRFSPDMKWFITAANRLNHVDIYRWDGSNPTLVQRISTGKTPSHLWIDAKSTTIYSTMQDSDELVAIDIATQKLLWRVPTGSMPADLYGSPDGKHIFIGLTGSDGVEVFSITPSKAAQPAQRVGQIPTAKGAHAFRALGDGRHLLVSNRVANTISKIDMVSHTVVDNYPAPGGPDCMDVTTDRRYIYLSSRWARKLSVIDMVEKKVIRQVNVGKSPHGVWTLAHAPR